jgi:hypothetical protein
MSRTILEHYGGEVGPGQTVCCWVEVFRRSLEQAKAPGGRRKSRWAIVRNTSPQLRTTTIKTWLEWLRDGGARRNRSIYWRTMGVGSRISRLAEEILAQALLVDQVADRHRLEPERLRLAPAPGPVPILSSSTSSGSLVISFEILRASSLVSRRSEAAIAPSGWP